MEIELIVLLTMLGVFLAGNFLLKLPVSLSMVLGAVGGALVAGQGFPLRHLFEGTFVYVDTFLIIASAMVFMTVIEASGALEALNAAIVHRFHKVPALMLVLLMLMVMFPGMVTGSSTAAVLSSGALVAPVFLMLGIPKAKVGAILALGAIMGMAAPPVNIPAMLIAGGVDMPYIGFEGPLLLLTIPGAIGVVLALGYKYARKMDRDTVLTSLNTDIAKQYGVKIYLPLALLVVLLVLTRALPGTVPNLGMPLIFAICSVAAMFTGRKFKVLETVRDAIHTTIPVLGKLVGVGMFIQVMTLTGVRGYIVINCLSLGPVLLYLAICLAMPAFGAVSSYGAASVLGVPFLLALLASGNQIIIAAALSFICCLGDLMPPTALAGNYAARIVELKYSRVLVHCIAPFVLLVLFGLALLLWPNAFAFLV